MAMAIHKLQANERTNNKMEELSQKSARIIHES